MARFDDLLVRYTCSENFSIWIRMTIESGFCYTCIYEGKGSFEGAFCIVKYRDGPDSTFTHP